MKVFFLYSLFFNLLFATITCATTNISASKNCQFLLDDSKERLLVQELSDYFKQYDLEKITDITIIQLPDVGSYLRSKMYQHNITIAVLTGKPNLTPPIKFILDNLSDHTKEVLEFMKKNSLFKKKAGEDTIREQEFKKEQNKILRQIKKRKKFTSDFSTFFEKFDLNAIKTFHLPDKSIKEGSALRVRMYDFGINVDTLSGKMPLSPEAQLILKEMKPKAQTIIQIMIDKKLLRKKGTGIVRKGSKREKKAIPIQYLSGQLSTHLEQFLLNDGSIMSTAALPRQVVTTEERLLMSQLSRDNINEKELQTMKFISKRGKEILEGLTDEAIIVLDYILFIKPFLKYEHELDVVIAELPFYLGRGRIPGPFKVDSTKEEGVFYLKMKTKGIAIKDITNNILYLSAFKIISSFTNSQKEALRISLENSKVTDDAIERYFDSINNTNPNSSRDKLALFSTEYDAWKFKHNNRNYMKVINNNQEYINDLIQKANQLEEDLNTIGNGELALSTILRKLTPEEFILISRIISDESIRLLKNLF